MTATIVQFGKKTPAKIQKKVKAAEDGLDLDPPTTEDLKGFINTLNFLSLQSATGSASVDIMDDELNIKIQHHDRSDFNDDGDIISATSFEIMAGIEFLPQDHKKTIASLLIAFERLDFDNYEQIDVEATFAEDEDDGTPTT